MRGGHRAIWLRAIVAAVLVLTASTAPMHRAAAPVDSIVDVSAYALPDGSLPWICVFLGGDRSDDAPPTACEFGLAAAVSGDLVAPPSVLGLRSPFDLGRPALPRAPPAADARDTRRPEPRAPPFA